MNKSTLVLTLAISGVLTACGGGGGSSGGGSTSSVMLASSSVATVASSSVVSVASSSEAASSSSTANTCTDINTAQGYASMGNGTTGGADTGLGNNTVTVSTGTELNNVLLATNATYKDKPLIVYINGTITWANSNNAEIRLRRSNVSIIGMPDSGEFSGVGIRISHGASNIVIRNLLMHEVPQANGAGDHINLDGQDGAVSNIWIDHNEFYNNLAVVVPDGTANPIEYQKDYYDELVSGRSRVHNVTISNNFLHDSHKTSLWGSSDTAVEEDVGRTISFHHNYWKDVVSRLPLFRFGEGHLWNNYYNGVTGSAMNSRMGAKLRIDNNVFENVKNPILSVDSASIGYWNATGNTFTNVSWGGTSTTSCATPPCYAGGNTVTTDYQPPYAYTAQDASTVKAYVMENAGRNKINSCLNLPEVSSSSSSSESSSSSSAPSGGTDVSTSWSTFDANTYISILANPVATTSNNVITQSAIAYSVNGLNLFHNTTGTLRHRGTAPEWNFNGSGWASGNPVTAVGEDAAAMRAYIGVPVDAGRAVTLTVVHRSSSAGTVEAIVFVGSDDKILYKSGASVITATTTTFSLPAGHVQTEVKILFSREGGAGGMHVTSIDKTYN